MSKAKIFKFGNGATIIYKKRKMCNATAVCVGFFAGFYYNVPVNGIQHLSEHMLLKQTHNRTLDDITKDKVRITYLNAYTSPYELAVDFFESNKRINACFEFASDVLLNTKLDNNQIENEIKVVLEEKARKKDIVKKNIYNMHYRFLEPNFHLNEDFIFGDEEQLVNVNKNDIESFITNNFVSELDK